MSHPRLPERGRSAAQALGARFVRIDGTGAIVALATIGIDDRPARFRTERALSPGESYGTLGSMYPGPGAESGVLTAREL